MRPNMTPKDKIFLTVSIISFSFLLGMGMIERNYLRERNDGKPLVCASDAQICPDGSAVSRTIPSCTFEPCPVVSHATTTQTVSGQATATPVHGSGSGSICSMEAKICPDGTAVRRSGLKCEFATCENPPPATTRGTSGACSKDSDCALGYSCIDPSPIAREGYGNLMCWKNGSPRPICLSGETRIATPRGEKLVRDIIEGDIVLSVDNEGRVVSVPVRISAHTQAPFDHHVVDLILLDGRELIASPGHPLYDGRKLGSLNAGDTILGVSIISATLQKYTEQYTYDILPASDTGMYFANGILLRSTLTK